MPTRETTTAKRRMVPSRRRTTPTRASAPLRVLVATTGEADSLGALHVAAELARARDATVMAVGVVTPFPHTVSAAATWKTPVVIDEEGRRSVLERIKGRIHDLEGADRWLKRAIVGWPADVINDTANDWKASLMILGMTHHSRIERFLGRDAAVAVIRHARRPVLCVPPRVRSLPRHAVAAIDFTPASLTAAEVAASLLARGGTLTLAHVCAFGGVAARDGGLVDVYRAGAQAKLEEAIRALRGRTRHRVTGVMVDGEPGEALLALARRSGADLLALGGHEQGLVDRVLLGSVRTRVLRSAPCSVLIAPPRAAG